jgi:hypothetical protein
VAFEYFDSTPDRSTSATSTYVFELGVMLTIDLQLCSDSAFEYPETWQLRTCRDVNLCLPNGKAKHRPSYGERCFVLRKHPL